MTDEKGYTLIETLAVLAILTTVVGAVMTLFVSGSKAEVEMNQRFQAQNSARLALDRLRRDVHCAEEATASSSTAVTLEVPCATGGFVSWCSAAVDGSTTRFGLYRIAASSGCDSSAQRVADYLTTGALFTYQTQSLSSLAKLRVDLPVKLDSMETPYRLCDMLVLRNSIRNGSTGSIAPPC